LEKGGIRGIREIREIREIRVRLKTEYSILRVDDSSLTY
jgi:hypothetical protein